MGMETMIKSEHHSLVKDMKGWVEQYCLIQPRRLRLMQQRHHVDQYQPADVFIGYQDDIISSIILAQGAKVRKCMNT